MARVGLPCPPIYRAVKSRNWVSEGKPRDTYGEKGLYVYANPRAIDGAGISQLVGTRDRDHPFRQKNVDKLNNP